MIEENRVFQSVELTSSLLQEMDCVVISTNHDVFDADFIVDHSRMVVDLRNAVREPSEKVYKL